MTTYRPELAKQIDPYTDSIMTIDRLITTIFGGFMFNVSSYFTLGEASREFLIQTPSVGPAAYHVFFEAHGTYNFNVSIYEDTTKVYVGGNALPVINRNRTSSNTPNIQVCHSPSGTGNGDLLYSNQWGSAAGIAGQSLGESGMTEARQWVFPAGSKYLAVITSTEADNLMGVSADIVEFTSEDNTYFTKPYSS